MASGIYELDSNGNRCFRPFLPSPPAIEHVFDILDDASASVRIFDRRLQEWSSPHAADFRVYVEDLFGRASNRFGALGGCILRFLVGQQRSFVHTLEMARQLLAPPDEVVQPVND
jgi:hypothetical protein